MSYERNESAGTHVRTRTRSGPRSSYSNGNITVCPLPVPARVELLLRHELVWDEGVIASMKHFAGVVRHGGELLVREGCSEASRRNASGQSIG